MEQRKASCLHWPRDAALCPQSPLRLCCPPHPSRPASHTPGSRQRGARPVTQEPGSSLGDLGRGCSMEAPWHAGFLHQALGALPGESQPPSYAQKSPQTLAPFLARSSAPCPSGPLTWGICRLGAQPSPRAAHSPSLRCRPRSSGPGALPLPPAHPSGSRHTAPSLSLACALSPSSPGAESPWHRHAATAGTRVASALRAIGRR